MNAMLIPIICPSPRAKSGPIKLDIHSMMVSGQWSVVSGQLFASLHRSIRMRASNCKSRTTDNGLLTTDSRSVSRHARRATQAAVQRDLVEWRDEHALGLGVAGGEQVELRHLARQRPRFE